MAYQDPTQVNVTLQTSATVREGFGTQIIVDAHAWFRERVRAYTSSTAALADLPSDSDAYIALSAAFAQSPQSAAVKIGRRESVTTLTPQNVAENTVYTVDVEVNEGDSVAASYTAGALDTAEDIAAALKTAIDANADVAAHVTTTVVGVGAAGTLTIEATLSTDEYAVSNLGNLAATFASTEAAADTMAAIDLQDTDYAFVTATDHTEAFVLAMAAHVETLKKLYATSSQNEDTLAVLASPATDTLGKLKDFGYNNTITMYAQDADTTFPECALGGRWLPTSPGTEAWYHKDLSGVPAATALNGGTTPVNISDTQKNNLDARNCNYVHIYKGLKTVEGGKTTSGERIHVQRFAYFIEARSEEVKFNFLYNQSAVSHNKNGYVALRSVLTTEWDKYVDEPGNKQGLDSETPYVFTTSPGENVTQADRIAGTYTDGATLYLAGAIKIAVLNIDLTYPA